MTPFSKNPPSDTVTDLRPEQPERPESERLRGYTKSEQVVMGEGQYDGALDQGPEKRNPEGSVDISNPQAGHES